MTKEIVAQFTVTDEEIESLGKDVATDIAKRAVIQEIRNFIDDGMVDILTINNPEGRGGMKVVGKMEVFCDN